MANYQSYLPKYQQAEGSNYVPNDISAGVGTKFGVSAGLYKDATGKTLTESQLQAADWATVEPAVRFVWNKLMGDKINSQKVAEVIIDHAENKGWVLMQYNLQYLLNDLYGANLAEDGKVGSLTIGALNAAISKYGEDKVYADVREYRRRYYLGEGVFCKAGKSRPWCEGYKNTQLGGVLVASRLDRYYPSVGGTNPFGENTGTAGNLSLGEILGQTTKDTLFNPKSWKDWALLVIALVGVFFGTKYILKQRGMAKPALKTAKT